MELLGKSRLNHKIIIDLIDALGSIMERIILSIFEDRADLLQTVASFRIASEFFAKKKLDKHPELLLERDFLNQFDDYFIYTAIFAVERAYFDMDAGCNKSARRKAS